MSSCPPNDLPKDYHGQCWWLPCDTLWEQLFDEQPANPRLQSEHQVASISSSALHCVCKNTQELLLIPERSITCDQYHFLVSLPTCHGLCDLHHHHNLAHGQMRDPVLGTLSPQRRKMTHFTHSFVMKLSSRPQIGIPSSPLLSSLTLHKALLVIDIVIAVHRQENVFVLFRDNFWAKTIGNDGLRKYFSTCQIIL